MSPAMVRHYAREVRKHRLAINAMKKLEAGWKGIRGGVLREAQNRQTPTPMGVGEKHRGEKHVERGRIF
jgi:hypothetical protein